MAAKRRGASKRASAGIPAWFWLLGGILIGLGIAFFLMLKGYLPDIKQHLPTTNNQTSQKPESALVEDKEDKTGTKEQPRYDFFTVLPEMEVIVPEQELSRDAKPTADTPPGHQVEQYVLQVESFRNTSDADQMKARLALLGSMATIQTVTVNGETWHRVRVGPIEGARNADEMRRLLADNRIETLVMKVAK